MGRGIPPWEEARDNCVGYLNFDLRPANDMEKRIIKIMNQKPKLSVNLAKVPVETSDAEFRLRSTR